MSALLREERLATPACQLGLLDHYTLIVEDAEAVSSFHSEMLGFELLEVRPLNTGTAQAGEFDMLNYIMRFPGETDRTLVITEGLTDESVFRRHLRDHGPGIHHMAYQVDDIETAVETLRRAGAKLLSDTIMRDERSGLRQIFVELPGAGYTLELIERRHRSLSSEFEDQNMVGLAKSIGLALVKGGHEGEVEDDACVVERHFTSSPREVRKVLADPGRLGEWTGHRTVRRMGEIWREVRWIGDAQVVCEQRAGSVHYTWRMNGERRDFVFELRAEDGGCAVSMALPAGMSRVDRMQLVRIFQAELVLLAVCLGEVIEPSVEQNARAVVEQHALAIMRREGL
jgi:lactoylglutathione lyase/methylmalonyl-CoA/ethylmalonyl-CoA epimerase